MEEKPVLYISGQFSSADLLHGVEQNILTASKYAIEAWKKGWAVFCPHKNSAGFQHTALPWELWVSGDLAFIDRMNPVNGDAVLMLPDWEQSRGAMIEYQFAVKKGLKIYYAAESVPSFEKW